MPSRSNWDFRSFMSRSPPRFPVTTRILADQPPERILGQFTLQQVVDVPPGQAVADQPEDLARGGLGLRDLGLALGRVEVERGVSVAAAPGHFLDVQGREPG